MSFAQRLLIWKRSMQDKWVVELANRRNRMDHQRAAIQRGIEDLWKNLCAALSDAVRDYRQIYPKEHLETNGDPYSSWVLKRLSDAESPAREIERLEVLLDRHAHTISVNRADGSNAVFHVTADDSGTVRLGEGKQSSAVASAARTILEPFLFPDLQSQSVNLWD